MHTVRHFSRAGFASVAFVAAFLGLAPSSVDAQVIVYEGSSGPPPSQPSYAAQPAYSAQPVVVTPAPTAPRTFGNLVGRSAFYGRLTLGLGSDFFRIAAPGSGSADTLTSPITLHVDFALGVRFAFTHALHVDFDFDRGFAPRQSGSPLTDALLYSGAFGAGYTHFFGTGLYVSLGAGLGIAWLQFSNAYSTSTTGVGFAAHGRIGYDWSLSPRGRLGVGLTLRYYGLTDEKSNRWSGATLAWAVSFAWY